MTRMLASSELAPAWHSSNLSTLLSSLCVMQVARAARAENKPADQEQQQVYSSVHDRQWQHHGGRGLKPSTCLDARKDTLPRCVLFPSKADSAATRRVVSIFTAA